MIHVAFTGTREGMSTTQQQYLTYALKRMRQLTEITFHHGDCIGSDGQACGIARAIGCHIAVHPPTNEKNRAFAGEPLIDSIYPAADYKIRDEQMLDMCILLFAAPKDPSREEFRGSGTWFTIRAAARRTMPIVMLPRGL